MRLFLEYREGSVELSPGETIVGRHVSCSLRFNDPFVSRRHLRIEFGDDGVFVEELVSRNGSLLNGAPIEGQQRLQDGDTLQLGKRSLRVLLIDESVDDGGEATRPDTRDLTPGLGGIEIELQELERPDTLPAPLSERTCPVCRTRVPAVADTCSSCGHTFPTGRPGSQTLRIDLSEVEAHIGALDRRSGARRTLDVPLVYTSEALTIDAVTCDLSRAGVFIRSQLLDEAGTRCHVTLLPEAAPAIPIGGVVARVVQSQESESSGMGIHFDELSERARLWLEVVLDRGAA
jgi:pSer/pThr/pTyr-binding forkhead associated (FHA) protein